MKRINWSNVAGGMVMFLLGALFQVGWTAWHAPKEEGTVILSGPEIAAIMNTPPPVDISTIAGALPERLPDDWTPDDCRSAFSHMPACPSGMSCYVPSIVFSSRRTLLKALEKLAPNQLQRIYFVDSKGLLRLMTADDLQERKTSPLDLTKPPNTVEVAEAPIPVIQGCPKGEACPASDLSAGVTGSTTMRMNFEAHILAKCLTDKEIEALPLRSLTGGSIIPAPSGIMVDDRGVALVKCVK